jgi:hypothetical protein
MQEVIEFDADRLNILSVESGQLTVTEDQYTIQGNKLKLSLAGHLNQIVKPGEAVFYLVVQALNDLQICDHIRLDQSALNAEWYDGNLKIHPIQFQCSKLNEIADGSTTKLFQNKPNPFNESTRVSFYLADSQDVDFVFYEVNGKVIYKLSKFYSKGYHEFDLKKSELNSYGVLFMQMNTENFTDTRRIVLIR